MYLHISTRIYEYSDKLGGWEDTHIINIYKNDSKYHMY